LGRIRSRRERALFKKKSFLFLFANFLKYFESNSNRKN
jgi:hypothetical protein